MTHAVPISVVRTDGRVEAIGAWHHESSELELHTPGFPLLAVGQHRLEGQLPWLFWDMCPSGYLGRRLARHPHLARLPHNPRDWIATDVLEVLQATGAELAGNVLVGARAVDDFHAWQHDPRTTGALLDEVLRDVGVADMPSSLGGERPKLLGSRANGTGYLMKFSPPALTPQGERWADLLRFEALCAQTLREVGVTAAKASIGETRGRTTLTIDRFDRLKGRGRRGAATLYWLAMDRWGDVALPAPEVVRRLHEEGVVSVDDVETVSRVHAFSAAIGNNDAHLGNYGLLFDHEGRATLAPMFDILPMVFAPRNDELPDDYLAPRSTDEDPRISPWVAHLRALVATSAISDAFQDQWRAWSRG